MIAPEDYFYTEDHEWLRMVSEDVALVGITDYAQDQLGEVVYVELPQVGTSVEAGEAFGSIESVKASSELYAPVTGKVVEVNTGIEETPEQVNQSPYEEGWMIKIRVEDPTEVHGLMDAETYRYHVKRLDKDEEPAEEEEEESEEE